MDVFVNIKIWNLSGEAVISLTGSMLIAKLEGLAFILYATILFIVTRNFYLYSILEFRHRTLL
jgi:hypothetical protein